MSRWVTVGQKQDRVYHTNKECSNLKREPMEVSQADTERMHLRECKVCANAVENDECGNRMHQKALKNAAKNNQ